MGGEQLELAANPLNQPIHPTHPSTYLLTHPTGGEKSNKGVGGEQLELAAKVRVPSYTDRIWIHSLPEVDKSLAFQVRPSTHPPTHPTFFSTYLPTHPPNPYKQHLVPTASFSSYPPTHPPTRVTSCAMPYGRATTVQSLLS